MVEEHPSDHFSYKRDCAVSSDISCSLLVVEVPTLMAVTLVVVGAMLMMVVIVVVVIIAVIVTVITTVMVMVAMLLAEQI